MLRLSVSRVLRLGLASLVFSCASEALPTTATNPVAPAADAPVAAPPEASGSSEPDVGVSLAVLSITPVIGESQDGSKRHGLVQVTVKVSNVAATETLRMDPLGLSLRTLEGSTKKASLAHDDCLAVIERGRSLECMVFFDTTIDTAKDVVYRLKSGTELTASLPKVSYCNDLEPPSSHLPITAAQGSPPPSTSSAPTAIPDGTYTLTKSTIYGASVPKGSSRLGEVWSVKGMQVDGVQKSVPGEGTEPRWRGTLQKNATGLLVTNVTCQSATFTQEWERFDYADGS